MIYLNDLPEGFGEKLDPFIEKYGNKVSEDDVEEWIVSEIKSNDLDYIPNNNNVFVMLWANSLENSIENYIVEYNGMEEMVDLICSELPSMLPYYGIVGEKYNSSLKYEFYEFSKNWLIDNGIKFECDNDSYNLKAIVEEYELSNISESLKNNFKEKLLKAIASDEFDKQNFASEIITNISYHDNCVDSRVYFGGANITLENVNYLKKLLKEKLEENDALTNSLKTLLLEEEVDLKLKNKFKYSDDYSI